MHYVTVHVYENNVYTLAGRATVAKNPWVFGDMMVKAYLQSTGGERHVKYNMEVFWLGSTRTEIYYSEYVPQDDTEQDDTEQGDNYIVINDEL